MDTERVAATHTVTITITTQLPLDESDDGLAALAMYAARDIIDPERMEAGCWFSVQHNDGYGRVWNLSPEELCPVCGQPDNCGDCNHEPLSDEDYVQLNSGSSNA